MTDDNSTSQSANYDPSKDPKRKAKSKDPGWKYGFWPVEGNHDLVQCSLCGKRVHSGIKRLKQHLSGLTYGDTTKCPNTTAEIREEMITALNNKRRAPRVQLDDDFESEEVATTDASIPTSHPSSGTAAKKAKASFFSSMKSESTQQKETKATKRLNDLVYVQYNRKIETRFKRRRAEGKGFDPLVLDDFQWDNEWINVDGDLVHPNEELWWLDVDRAIGASTSIRNLRSGSRDEGGEDVEPIEPIVLDDVDVEDDYGIGSPPPSEHEHSDHEGYKDFDFDY